MLKRLKVENFAIIDDIDIVFNDGLSVITGETGSGKSILLESLSLLFGKRSDIDFIRHNEERAFVLGEFYLNKPLLNEFELSNPISLSRTIEKNGRHTIRLNNQVITLSYLRELTNKLGLIHGQNDLQLIEDKEEYINFLDQVNELESKKQLNSYLLKKSSYEDLLSKYKELMNKKDKSSERIDYLTYQINELESYNLVLNEKIDLEDKILKLENFDKIKSSLSFVYNALKGEQFNLDLLYEASGKIKSLSNVDQLFEKLSKITDEAYYNLEDVISEINNYLYNLDFDEELFQFYQERLYELDKIEKKYLKSTNELIIYLSEIKEELLLINNYDKFIFESKEKLNKAFLRVIEEGNKLTKIRKDNALLLEKELTSNLHNLDLKNAKFKVLFLDNKDKTLYDNGLDNIDFLISFNEGEPLKPISKVASGGEKARFMFSLKALFAKLKNLSLLVFDEIDIGISGKTAAKVASEMKLLSNEIQTIVITHLPQVASRASNHYHITKKTQDSRVTTQINLLNQDDRVLIIASMLSDDEISSYAIDQAKALINNN